MTRSGNPRRSGAMMVAATLALLCGLPALAETATPPLSKECQMDALHRSACIFELILDDLKATFPLTGGGGISAIKQDSTTSFTASISQEEGVHHVTYEIAIAEDGKVSIANKVEK
ncbi:hypothetical protein RNZ50_21785 [Paracoccaceae bacterium Fryx2]|nr:hypothetical protein [Paracoccaceae bacterium Fryx2]